MINLEREGRFAAALGECNQRVQHGEILEVCIATYPAEYHAELARLVPLSLRLGQLGAGPRPAFQAQLEQRLLARIAEERSVARQSIFARIGRFVPGTPALKGAIVALVVFVVLAGTGVGVVQAADGSLPDSPLYQLKQAREWVKLTLARDDQAQVGVRANLVAERGREVEQAVRSRKGRAVAEVVAARLAQSTRRMVDLAMVLKARGNPQPAARALTAIRTLQRRLDQLEAQAAPDVRPVIERMLNVLGQQERRLLELGVDRRQNL